MKEPIDPITSVYLDIQVANSVHGEFHHGRHPPDKTVSLPSVFRPKTPGDLVLVPRPVAGSLVLSWPSSQMGWRHWNLTKPSRERIHIPSKMAFWVDDFPNFPRWDMLVPFGGICIRSLEGNLWHNGGCFKNIFHSAFLTSIFLKLTGGKGNPPCQRDYKKVVILEDRT